jgi:hypothetical protein
MKFIFFHYISQRIGVGAGSRTGAASYWDGSRIKNDAAPVLTLTPTPLAYIVKKSKIDNEYLILSLYRQRKGV